MLLLMFYRYVKVQLVFFLQFKLDLRVGILAYAEK